MKLLEAEPTLAPSAPAPSDTAPDDGARASEIAEAPERACETCGAAMAPDQDWCLTCGTAAPGRLGQRPGWRAAMTVLALTLLLVAGSVAAAYAALTSDATQEAGSPPPPAADAIAAAPPATPPSSAQPPAPKTDLPKVDPGASSGSAVKPVKPATSTSTPRVTTPTTSAPTTTPSTSTTTKPSTSTKPSPPASSTTKPAAPVAIDLRQSAGALYDPYGQAVTPGDPAKALDGNAGTGFTTGAKTESWGVGYVVDAQQLRGLREVDLATSTPGFRVEIYATDEATPPPDITDTRWAHLKDRSDVGASGDKERIVLGLGSTKYRTLLVWITGAPSQGSRVRLDELALLG